MKRLAALILAVVSGIAFAKLPPISDEAKAKAAEAAAKASWNDKMAMFQLCAAMDRTADAYRRSVKALGKEAPAPAVTAPCANPGQYVASASPITPEASKPLEASGAHSPPGTAQSPPSTNAPASEMPGKK